MRPDVVFLDVDMPELNGLETAERLQELNPSVEIVFVTAYERFAVKAFELQALDYVLKPLQPVGENRPANPAAGRKRGAPSGDPKPDRGGPLLSEHEHRLRHGRTALLADVEGSGTVRLPDYPWAEQERQRLRSKWYQHAMTLGRFWEACDQPIEALDWYLRIQRKFPYGEEVYFALMRVYAEMGQSHFVEQQYVMLAAMLEEEYGVAPSEQTAEWYRQWRTAAF